jgi:outer membrane lipoprotein SlyB
VARIVAGRFETQPQADAALAALSRTGFQKHDYTCFYLTPPGQHGVYPIGGDAHHDEGTKESGQKAITAAAIGSVTGLALGTATGAALGEPGFTAAGAIAGAGIGGYVGSLAGGLTGSRAGDPTEATKDEPVERPSGMMVAIRLDEGREDEAVRALRDAGALEIERAEGEWRNGAWVDFDPRRIAHTIDPLEG